MAESVVSIVAERLGDLLIEEAKFLHGVSGQIELIQLELELMQTYLEDADKRQIQDKRVETWISKIRETAYDVEDVVETFLLKIASRRRSGFIKRYACILKHAAELHKVGSQIEDIKTRITTLTRCLQTYGIKHIKEAGDQGGLWRQSYSHVVEEFTVGLDKDREILVGKLVNIEEQQCCGVVSICGMGGLGKTTLAKKVYHHNEIRNHFGGFAWAFISQQCQPRNVWEGILFELISPPKEEREEILKYTDAGLLEKLCKVQQEKKCLVILDDIWTMQAWDSLRHAFPLGKLSGSKILLTTRNMEVAERVDRTEYLHKLQLLNINDGWTLLQKTAFPQESNPIIDEEVKKLGKEMVQRCECLPLAIVVLGGILAGKPTKEWKMVHENISSYLRSGKGHEQQQSDVTEILALSYHELPYQLKPCFLYLGHFPEDFNIPTKKLVRMWVAEGLVSPGQYEIRGAKTLEDVGVCYLEELLNRNMVHVGERGSTGRVKTCRLHDLMRDLCLLKANEENFLESFRSQDGNEPIGDCSVSSMITTAKQSRQIRRIGMLCKKGNSEIYSENNFLKSGRTAYLRSLLFFSSSKYYTVTLLYDFKLLKVLDLETCQIEKLSRRIGGLIHLRYLTLNFKGHLSIKIPSSIGNLRCLQTLIISNVKDSKFNVPNVIWKMESLRYLCLPLCMDNSRRKLRLDNLRHLQTLQNFDAKIFDVKNLKKSTNLKKLGILNFSSTGFEELSSNVSLNRLCSLKIKISVSDAFKETNLRELLSSCPNLCKLHLEGEINGKLPEDSQFPPNLAKLTLQSCKLKDDPMATLEKLPNLTVLRLKESAFIGNEMTCSANGFPKLKTLQLTKLDKLKGWHVNEEAMPILVHLVVGGCTELKMLPRELRGRLLQNHI